MTLATDNEVLQVCNIVLVVAGTDLVCVCRVWIVAVVAGTDLVHVCRV